MPNAIVTASKLRSAKRQRLGVRFHKLHDVVESALGGTRTPDREHAVVDVRDGYACARPAGVGHPERDIAGAAREIEQRERLVGLFLKTAGAAFRRRIERVDHHVLPGAMQAAGHEVVHQVVARRHAMKHAIDEALLVGQRHLAEAEMGLLGLGHGAHCIRNPGGFNRGSHHIIGIMATEIVNHHVFDTALGPCGVAWTAHGLTHVQFANGTAAETEQRLVARTRSAGAAEPPASVAAIIEDIKRYFAGEPVDFSAAAVDFSGLDPYRRRLYEAMRTLKWGETTTYGGLARQLGSSDWEGAREVGEAMGRNPMPIVIPCHRVLAAGGKLGGFSAPGGAATKAKLLALEGVRVDRAEPRLPGL